MSSLAISSKPSEHNFKNEYINKGLVELSLEGISVPADMMADLALLDNGKLSREEFFLKEVAKAKKNALENKKCPIVFNEKSMQDLFLDNTDRSTSETRSEIAEAHQSVQLKHAV